MATNGMGKIFTNYISYKGLICTIYKELRKFNNKLLNEHWIGIDISPNTLYK